MLFDIYRPSDEIRKKKNGAAIYLLNRIFAFNLSHRSTRIADKGQIWTRGDNVNAITASGISTVRLD